MTALSHFPTISEGRTGDQYLYECRVSTTWQASIQSGKHLSDIPVMGTRLQILGVPLRQSYVNVPEYEHLPNKPVVETV
jgi:hypothetical protein